MDAALAPLRYQDIRVLNYIDDWLILAGVQGDGSSTFRCCFCTHKVPGFETELQEMCTFSSSPSKTDAKVPSELVETLVLSPRTHVGSIMSSQNIKNRYFSYGLRGYLRWPFSSRSVERSPSFKTHKLPSDEGCISGTEILTPRSHGLPYSCPVRKYIYSLTSVCI